MNGHFGPWSSQHQLLNVLLLSCGGLQSSQKWGGDPLRQQGAASTSRPPLKKGEPRL
jgi:hypothetical protein